MSKSPIPYAFTEGNPFPFNLRILPDCIPSSNLIFTFPLTVGISDEVPIAASAKLI